MSRTDPTRRGRRIFETFGSSPTEESSSSVALAGDESARLLAGHPGKDARHRLIRQRALWTRTSSELRTTMDTIMTARNSLGSAFTCGSSSSRINALKKKECSVSECGPCRNIVI